MEDDKRLPELSRPTLKILMSIEIRKVQKHVHRRLVQVPKGNEVDIPLLQQFGLEDIALDDIVLTFEGNVLDAKEDLESAIPKDKRSSGQPIVISYSRK